MKEDLVLLRLTIDQASSRPKWLSKDEFVYENQLYDVVETRYSGEVVEFLCWPDHEEQEANARLEETLSLILSAEKRKNSAKLDSIPYNLHTFLNALYAIVIFPEKCPCPDWNFGLGCILFSKFSCLTIPPPVPPPKICG